MKIQMINQYDSCYDYNYYYYNCHNNGSLGTAPTFLKLDSWSPGSGFIPIISSKGINQIKKEKW